MISLSAMWLWGVGSDSVCASRSIYLVVLWWLLAWNQTIRRRSRSIGVFLLLLLLVFHVLDFILLHLHFLLQLFDSLSELILCLNFFRILLLKLFLIIFHNFDFILKFLKLNLDHLINQVFPILIHLLIDSHQHFSIFFAYDSQILLHLLGQSVQDSLQAFQFKYIFIFAVLRLFL